MTNKTLQIVYIGNKNVTKHISFLNLSFVLIFFFDLCVQFNRIEPKILIRLN